MSLQYWRFIQILVHIAIGYIIFTEASVVAFWAYLGAMGLAWTAEAYICYRERNYDYSEGE